MYETYPYFIFNFRELDSTNSFLKKVAGFTSRPVLCTAAYQNQGYGQQGREWLSNDNDLIMSLMLSVSNRFIVRSGLSQFIALCFARSLSNVTDQVVQVKWPNDIFIDGGKAGGILIEIVRTHHDEVAIVIGFGLNLTRPADKVSFNYPVSWLISKLDRSQLIHLFATNLITALAEPVKENINPVQTDLSLLNLCDWSKFDYFKHNETIRVIHPNGVEMIGTYIGLSHAGEALVCNIVEPDNIIKLTSGSVQIRRFLSTVSDGMKI